MFLQPTTANLHLFALCSFYNHEWMTRLAREYSESCNPGELSAILDPARKKITADLLLNYCGW